MERVGKGEAASADVFRADLTRKVIKPAEEIGMDLLQTFDAARFETLQDAALKQ